MIEKRDESEDETSLVTVVNFVREVMLDIEVIMTETEEDCKESLLELNDTEDVEDLAEGLIGLLTRLDDTGTLSVEDEMIFEFVSVVVVKAELDKFEILLLVIDELLSEIDGSVVVFAELDVDPGKE